MGKERNKQANKLNDGLDIEYSQELADTDDLEAQERSREADKRAEERKL
jgi:hypothetical protein